MPIASYEHSIETLSGSYREMGRQHGRNNADHIRYLLEANDVNDSAPWGPHAFLDPLEYHLPDLVEEIHGIAEGSQCSLKEVCGLSFLIDLDTAPTACTGVAFATGPDGPVMGKTCDCSHGLQQVWLRPRLAAPSGQLGALMLSHVGSPNAEMGMNENGLAIGVTGLASLTVNPAGVGWQQDICAVLHRCSTTQEAIDLMKAIPIRGFGYCCLILDSHSEAAVVEKVAGAIGVKRSRTGTNVTHVTNVAHCPEILPHTPEPPTNGLERMELLRRLCVDETQMDFSLDGMLQLFLTHANPTGLCQHGPQLHSTTGFFMLPKTGYVRIARGYTCEREFEEFQF